MSINFRRPNGYFVTKYGRDHLDLDEVKKSLEEIEFNSSDSGFSDTSACNDSSTKVTLTYNGEQEIVVDRQAVANSCFYFQRLLSGSFKEATQSKVDIRVADNFSYKAFEGIVKYACDRSLDPAVEDQEFYYDMIQLASLWMYDELVEVLEEHLIANMTVETVPDIHTLANLLGSKRLKDGCLKLEQAMDLQLGTLNQPWARCPLPGHERHHYTNCVERTPQPLANDDDEHWD